MKEPLEFAHFLFVLILASDDDVLELLLTGTGRNEMTADDIPDFGNDSPYLFTPMYEASFKGTKR